jgi:hypothetical protein
VPVDRLIAAIQDDRADGDAGEHFDGREVGRVELDGRHVGVAVVGVEL